MFITRKEFERQIKKAKKRGAKEAYEKCSVQNSLDSVSRNMYDNVDRVHMEVDKILIRLDKLEDRLQNTRNEKKQ
jgi:hypothetical protein